MNKHCFINCLMLTLLTIPFIMQHPAAASGYPVTPLKSASIIKGQEQVVVSADQSSYNETAGRYALHGHVRIQSGPRTFLSASAQISTRTLQLWTESPTQLQEGELRFSGGAVYAELAGSTALFFGPSCKMERPGLAIQSDNMSYNWETHIATFDGHVLCIRKDERRAAGHLEFDLENNEIR